MEREVIKAQNVREDLLKVVGDVMTDTADWRFTFIVPTAAIAIILAIILKNVWIGLAISVFPLYHVVRYAIDTANHIKATNEIEAAVARDEFSVSLEKLSHISTETIYEPHKGISRPRMTKTVKFYYFKSGASWRVPQVECHYEWSRELYQSSHGLENISLTDDEFYLVSLKMNPSITYAYPKKLFDATPLSKREG